MIKNLITSILSLLWVLLAGAPAPVNDLRKKPTRETSTMRFYEWMNFYSIALAKITIILSLILFVIICFMIVGGSATESGTLYNQLGGTI